MSIDFTNTNLVWASILVETLARLGLKTAVICPGSRSAPLAIAFANHANIDSVPVLDERSAAFLLLSCPSAASTRCISLHFWYGWRKFLSGGD